MTIASELTKLNTNLTNAYTAVDGKGGTLPQAQNFDNLATAISSIPSGGGSFIGIPREVKNGVYQMPTENFSFSLPNNATDISAYGLDSAFRDCTGLTSIDLSSLTTVSGNNGLGNAFRDCTGLTSIDLSSLTTVSGNNGLDSAFRDCTGLTSIDLSSLTTVSGNNGLGNAFYGCTGLTSIDLLSLTSVGSSGLGNAFYGCKGLTSVDLLSLTSVGSSGLFGAFANCTGLTSVSFPALMTSSFGSYKNQFSSMLSSTGIKVTHTLHFPSNLQSTISGLTGYPNFGGTNGYVVCAFDLPATS